MPQGMGGLPPGADMESHWPGYGKKQSGLFAIPKNLIATSIASLSEESALFYQCVIL